MNRNKNFIVLVLLLALPGVLYAQESGRQSITVEDLQHHLSFIASDSLQGRSFTASGPGVQIAAEYLLDNAKKIGLKPAGDSYFQKFKITSTKPVEGGKFLTISKRNGKEIYKTESLICLKPQKDLQKVDGKVVFAGFGFRDEKNGYDDFDGMNLKGKTVLYFAGTPELYLQKDKTEWDNNLESKKIERSFEKGAGNVIIVTSPNDTKDATFYRIKHWTDRTGYTVSETNHDKNKPVYIISPQSAEVLLGGKRKMNKLLNSISKNKKPNSFMLDKFNIKIMAEYTTRQAEAENIIGVVEGSDPILKDECVVYMAHYDHLGMDKNGAVFNGADDNGSGTVSLLEIADAFMHLKTKPKRSVLFLWVTGEEVGLLGSAYYVQHPVFPLQKTVACINLDMVGRVYEPRDSIWKKSPKLVKDFNGVYTLTSDFSPRIQEITDSVCDVLNLIPDKSLPARFMRSSDQYNFHRNGVPILNLANGYHADYHKVTDVVSKINFNKMKRVADLAFLVGFNIANCDNGLKKEQAAKN